MFYCLYCVFCLFLSYCKTFDQNGHGLTDKEPAVNLHLQFNLNQGC